MLLYIATKLRRGYWNQVVCPFVCRHISFPHFFRTCYEILTIDLILQVMGLSINWFSAFVLHMPWDIEMKFGEHLLLPSHLQKFKFGLVLIELWDLVWNWLPPFFFSHMLWYTQLKLCTHVYYQYLKTEFKFCSHWPNFTRVARLTMKLVFRTFFPLALRHSTETWYTCLLPTSTDWV